MHFHSLALVLLSFLFSALLNLLKRKRMGRFKCLVESEEGMASFKAQYRIPPNANLRYCEEGECLDKILKAEEFVNEDDSQLRATHLILGVTLISRAFQEPKCVIKAHDPCLHHISVAVEGFLLPEGTLIPEGTFSTQTVLFLGPTTESTQSSTPIPEGIPKVRASSSQQFTEIATLSHTKNLEEEEVVELTDSEDKFEVFNQDLSLETSVTNLDPHFSPIINEMGI